MEIKKICYIPDQNHWEITLLDQITPLCLCEETVIHFELIQGKQISETLKSQILLFDRVQTFYTRALVYLNQRRTVKEVRDYLKRKYDLDSEVIDQVITTLENRRYLDDFLYGKAYLHDQVHFQKKSLETTLQKLKEKGIDSGKLKQLKDWFAQNEEMKQAETDTLRKLIHLQMAKLKIYNHYERNQRIIAKMMQKGYNRDIIKQLLEEFADPVLLDYHEKQQLFNKTKAKRQKMKSASQYAMYMKQYNLTKEEVIDFFHEERTK